MMQHPNRNLARLKRSPASWFRTSAADQGVRTQFIVDPNEFQIGVRLPIQGHVEVTGKDAPCASVIQLDDMTLGMGFDFQVWPPLALGI
jgi:hypothetical protein